MDKNYELYHHEIESLRKFKSKIGTHAIYKEDLKAFSDEYEELIAQIKVITKVSDRLQKKLDRANIQIKEQNKSIKINNEELSNTVKQLIIAKVGKKASTIMLTVAVILFALEQIFVEPIVEKNIKVPYVEYAILAVMFFLIKFFESRLEKYFLNQKKSEILKKEQKKKVK